MPEEEGLPSECLLWFLDAVRVRKINLHSFMLVRHGNILAEGYYHPFDENFMHRLYSSSKTFVSVAVGKLIGEGKLRLSDKIVDFFPEYRKNSDKWLAECTVENVLTMSVPMLTDTYSYNEKEWARSFFTALPDLKPAGTLFNYNTSGSFILGVLVEKLTGKSFLEYLRPEFDEIGISRNIWCVKSPDGFSWGGSGVVCTLRDFAKFAELILHRGEYRGKQLIPRSYMEAATSMRISNQYENAFSPTRNCGYGYQIWMTEHGFCLSGMGLQMAYCFPDKDMLFVCNGDTQCENDTSNTLMYDLVRFLLYDNAGDEKLFSGKSYELLSARIKSLELCSDFGRAHTRTEGYVGGYYYYLEENPMGWKYFRFDFGKDNGLLTYENQRGIKRIRFGLGKYIGGNFPETHYYDRQVGIPAQRELECLCAAGWVEENKFLLRIYITDCNLGNCFMTFSWKGDEVGVMMKKRAEFFLEDYEGFAGGKNYEEKICGADSASIVTVKYNN